MYRNEDSRFAINPVDLSSGRSRFDLSHGVKTTFNVGDLIPLGAPILVNPGDTMQQDMSAVVRMQPLVAPIYDNLYLDTFAFFVPLRLLWEHWEEFNGENKSGHWIPQVDYTIPGIESPDNGWKEGTIADYMGIPINTELKYVDANHDNSINALPFRGYAMIWNEFFRDQNLQDPCDVPLTDARLTGLNGDSTELDENNQPYTYINYAVRGGKPLKAAKYHDVYTSCLPGPLKGEDVSIDIITGTGAVYGNGYNLGLSNSASLFGMRYASEPNGNWLSPRAQAFGGELGQTGTGGTSPSTNTLIGVATKAQLGDHPEYSGLTADMGNVSNAISINTLRTAAAIQQYYERLALAGSRYREQIKSFFGVTSPDARLQVPEYLGGAHIPINITQVTQTSQSDSVSPLGNVAGQSVTADNDSTYTKSFTEHGLIFNLAVVRYHHTYQQGLNPLWSVKDKFDFYIPTFAHIGNVPLKRRELYLTSDYDSNNTIFGYQEAWYWYRQIPNIVTGEMRSAATTPLDSWHLADNYTTAPQLSSEWIEEDLTPVDRTLAVTSEVSNQLFGDFWIQLYATRVLPAYSIPGLNRL